MNWPAVRKTALIGTERAPLPESERAALAEIGIEPTAGVPARTALEALAAAHLLRKAGFFLPPENPPDESGGFQGHFFPEPESICPPAAADMLEMVLAGVHAEVLGEFLALLAASGRRLPPEFLPNILNRCVRQPPLFEKIKPALGARGAWLAGQNPDWRAFFEPPKTDWETGTFAERARLLHETRRSPSPPAATAWLEKTWAGERGEDKARFLRLLRPGLSLLDEDLLEKAYRDKNREVRWAALQLLCLLPSERAAGLVAFFRERLSGAFGVPDFMVFLETQLPDFEEEPTCGLVALLPGKEIGKHWRLAVFGLFLRLLPPGVLESASGKTAPEILAALTSADDPRADAVPALLEGAAFHGDEKWLAAVLRHFSKTPGHPIWQSEIMAEVFRALPERLWQAEMPGLLQCEGLLESAQSALHRGLSGPDFGWTREVLHGFLARLHRLSQSNRAWSLPVFFLRQTLEKAAFKCRPEDGLEARAWLLPPSGSLGQHPWQKELERFFEVLRFRAGFAAALGAA